MAANRAKPWFVCKTFVAFAHLIGMKRHSLELVEAVRIDRGVAAKERSAWCARVRCDCGAVKLIRMDNWGRIRRCSRWCPADRYYRKSDRRSG